MLSIENKEKEIILRNINETFSEEQNKINLRNGFFQKREVMKLPPSAKFILYLLKVKGPLNRKRIIKETMMPDRTVGFALKKLLDKNLIQKVNLDNSEYHLSKKRHKRRKQDRRITNYNLISTILPIQFV